MNWYNRITKIAYQVQTRHGPGELVTSPNDKNYTSSFSYQTDNSWTEIRIVPLSLFMGMLYPSASYIAIQAQEPSDETDKQIISLFMEKLNGFKDVQWSMGQNPMIDVLNQATGKNYTDDPDKVNMTEFEETEVLPLPKGMSVGYTSGTLKIIETRPGDAKFTINSILRSLEQIIQPFVENSLVDFYSIESQGYGDKHIKSQRGQEAFDSQKDTESIEIGYLKHVLNTVLSSYPNMLKRYLGYVNDRYPKIEQQGNTKTNLLESDLAEALFGGSTADKDALNTIVSFDDKRLSVIEAMMSFANKNKMDFNKYDVVMTWIVNDGNLKELLEDINSDKWLYLYTSFLDKDVREMLDTVGLGYRIDQIKYAIQESIPRVIDKKDTYLLIKKVFPIYKKLDLSPETVEFLQQIEQQHLEQTATVKKEEAERAKEEEKLITKRSFEMDWDCAYMDLNRPDDKFHRIPDKYVDGYSDDINLGEMVLHGRDIGVPFDDDTVRENAHYQAHEELSEKVNIPDRPSNSYGEDTDDVFDDIEEDFEEFASEMFSDDLDAFDEKYRKDPNRDKMLIDTIKKNHIDKFTEWKKDRMLVEEEESGEYETDYWIDDSELNSKISDIENEEAEKAAYEYGIMTAKADRAKFNSYDNRWETKSDSVEFWVHSKFLSQATEVIKKFIDINLGASKEEGSDIIFNNNSKVEIYLYDSGESIRKSPYEMKRASGGWYKLSK